MLAANYLICILKPLIVFYVCLRNDGSAPYKLNLTQKLVDVSQDERLLILLKLKMKVLELYSGIGGMHYALKASGVDGEIVTAVDINTTANMVYQYNFPNTKLLQRNIESLSAEDFNKLQINMILMSPPCQPFTRVGLKKDLADNRTDSFLHILGILPNLCTKWKYLLLENVKGFEKSEACQQLIATLEAVGFVYQQLLLSPAMLHIPNSRTRYYMIAKRKPLQFCFPLQPNVMEFLPTVEDIEDDHLARLILKYKSWAPDQQSSFPLTCVIEKDRSEEVLAKFAVPDKTLAKHARLMDIVTPSSTRSCCFTKAYGHYIEGTGSVLCPATNPEEISATFQESESYEKGSCEQLAELRKLNLRFFTPREVARLMCFPDEGFSFPEHTTNKQCYRLLGNSINVHVVAVLIKLLTQNDASQLHPT